MANILHIIQIVSGVLTIGLVLLQRASTDMGGSIGGEGTSFAHTRRGGEKFFFFTTIVFAIIFVASSIAVIVLQ
jgi:protein translocase SecG subunit